MLLSSLCFVAFAELTSHQEWQLWAGALIMAAGFASSLPCAITMPSEAGVVITPVRPSPSCAPRSRTSAPGLFRTECDAPHGQCPRPLLSACPPFDLSAKGRLLAMNLAGSAGESIMPFIFGAAFERGWYGAFGITLGLLNLAVLSATALARAVAQRGHSTAQGGALDLQ